MPAIEPPPAPISIMSMTGALIGRPEPRLKRCTRAASIVDATSMFPFSIRQAFAVVPPMSNEMTLFWPANWPNKAVARPPPAGPDSSSRIGNLRAAAGGSRRPNRNLGASRRGDEPARRMHEPKRATESARGKIAFQVREISIHQGLHIGIGAGRHGTRILAQLGDNLAGE